MTFLVLLRHGATEWNATGRMQGRRDEPLCAAGRAALAALRLPPELTGYAWLTSPLRRAVETALCLSIADARAEPRLIEMDWGDWEGHSLSELRALPNGVMARAEAAGLDFRPPGGESPRDVQHRIAPLLAEIARGDRPVAAITHKGVIRAVFAAATGWDMHGKPPSKLDWRAIHLFRLDESGRPAPLHLNLGMLPRRPTTRAAAEA
jgi:broad specificity phosphatase PhoE